MKLVFATHNPNKLKEVREMVPAHIELVGLNEIGCFEEIPETADTIEGNARLKAEYVRDHYGLPCFADDTGLEVSALNNAPGVYSARYAGPQKNATDNMNKLLAELKGMDDRSARFKTIIALALKDDIIEIPGICNGQITHHRQGEGGFGYDPVFRPEGYLETFGQLAPEVKARIGHRGKAVRALMDYLDGLSVKG